MSQFLGWLFKLMGFIYFWLKRIFFLYWLGISWSAYFLAQVVACFPWGTNLLGIGKFFVLSLAAGPLQVCGFLCLLIAAQVQLPGYLCVEAWWFLATWWAMTLRWVLVLSWEMSRNLLCSLISYALLTLCGGDPSLPALILGAVETDTIVPIGIQFCLGSPLPGSHCVRAFSPAKGEKVLQTALFYSLEAQ